MPVISESQALIFFGIILVTAILIAWWMGSYEDYDKGRFHTFIAILIGFGIFVTFLFYYNLIAIQGQQQQLASLQELARLNDSVLNSVLDEIKDASQVVPNFVLSITPLTNEICCFTGVSGTTATSCAVNPGTGCVSTPCAIPVGPDPVNPQTCTEKMVLSYRIFALWQDVITSSRFMGFDPTAYVTNFLQRANSPQLYAQWTASRFDFDDNTQQFGNLLFEYGLPITIQTGATYIAAAEKLIADPRYQAICQK